MVDKIRESMREGFSKWFNDRYGEIKVNPVDRSILYGAQWAAWQASRAAIEVQLPDCDDYQSTWQYQDEAEERIRSIGLKIKGDTK